MTISCPRCRHHVHLTHRVLHLRWGRDPARRRAVWLDLAYPEHRVGIEYEGAEHTDPGRVLRDTARYTRLVDARVAHLPLHQV